MAETVASPTPVMFPGTCGIAGEVATPVLALRNVEKVFGRRGSVTHALNGISFNVGKGEFIGIMGPSGSGKSTLLNCVATIDVPTSGHILVDGQDLTTLSKRQLAAFRRDQMGFVFQDFNLLDTLTAYENIALALTIKHARPSAIPSRVKSIAGTLGIEEVLDKYPYQMSGGQQQRVAAARAIVSDPKLVLADEPTGALDSRSAAVMLDTLDMMNRVLSATIMMVTHDAFAASFAQRVLFIKDGRLFNEIRRGDLSREDFFARILEVVAFLGGDDAHVA
ncbi:ABC transporter ATP-binding protein [Xiamenia xianingshaonis]|uniref:ATP-binding cassette domain-containing protein n=2 Tax=Xiamenia xianingshaonis TaxID=2682776 RepID=A0ABX0IFL3_9ACTN|nr:ATP-binding cassette domain-containing protein [Eggerthellaceae bacterium zg-893]NHM13400.1 ATP-binding cassette domain-containing protein [Xiamenia xianingshaonis]NHM15173.1 ATP-binding cassette domain-containing protein [Xiamenia xianingshaonis]